MSDQHGTPQWYTPHGSTQTAPRPPGTTGVSTPSQSSPSAPPPQGPLGPAGPSGNGSPSPRPGRRRTAELTAVAVLAALLSSGGTVAAVRLWDETQTPSAASTSSTQLGRGTDSGPVAQADPENPNWSVTAGAVSPSVVAISARSAQGQGAGSGVVIDGSGHVLTNNHVVAGAQELTVTLSDGRTFDATVQGTDPSTDLAVVTISNAPDDLTPIAFGDSDALEVGDPVMAVGNPLGLAGTVTTGIVSALNRPVTTQAEPSEDPFQQSQSDPVVTNAIQTSAAINPGNSGGALVNGSGQLVGINSSIASLGSSSGQSGNIGIGFAIPANEAKAIAEQLISTGSAEHAYLGVTPQDGTASDGSATRTGAEITSVGSGTPAEQAGLKAGDLITAVNGEPVDSALSLVAHIREQAVGNTVTLSLVRDGATIEVSTTLTARSQNG
jgi:putative serine protease PepD